MTDSYSRTQVALHWITAALIVVQFTAHEGMEEGWRTLRRTGEQDWTAGVVLHVAAGLAVLVLVGWRLVLRLRRGAPPPPADEPAALKLAARLTHGAIYLLLLAIPVSGAVAWNTGLGAAGEAHEVLGNALFVLVLVHVAGALVQHFVLRSDVMRRMVRPGR